jgi:serine/threonine protein kinase
MNDPGNIIEAIFSEAIAEPDHVRRAALLDAACGNHGQLRARVEALLRAHHEAGSFMTPTAHPADGSRNGTLDAEPGDVERHPFQRPSAPARDGTLAEGPGSVIGHYKLLQRIGEGGFGVVWMADQETPVRRRVALKIIKAGMDTKQVIARFEQERQALAMMDHPSIARVLDAGATTTGRPYFVMELVRGVKITDYCDDQGLSTAERIELFITVCQAIQHAHQKGIIHRDLKPSNILVTVNDGVPVPKVIDFGDAGAAHRRHAVHAVRADDRHAALHEPRAGRTHVAGRGHAQRHLCAGRSAV